MTNRVSRRFEPESLPHRCLGYEGYSDPGELCELENLYTIQRSTAAELENELEDNLRTVNWPHAEALGDLRYPLARKC